MCLPRWTRLVYLIIAYRKCHDNSYKKQCDILLQWDCARLRGEFIKSLEPDSKYWCDWFGIWCSDGTWLDVTDPELEEVPKWVEPTPRRSLTERGIFGMELLDATEEQYDEGDYQAALQYLRRCHRLGIRHSSLRHRRLHAHVQSRRGFLPLALKVLSESVGSSRCRSTNDVLELLDLHRYEGIVPGAGYLRLLEQARRICQQEENHDDHERFAHQGAEGLGHLLRSELSHAISFLRKAVSRPDRSRTYPRLYTRAKTDLADVYRRLGETELARRELAEAESIYLERGFTGEFSDYVLLRRPKLKSKSTNVLEILDHTERIQTGANYAGIKCPRHNKALHRSTLVFRLSTPTPSFTLFDYSNVNPIGPRAR